MSMKMFQKIIILGLIGFVGSAFGMNNKNSPELSFEELMFNESPVKSVTPPTVVQLNMVQGNSRSLQHKNSFEKKHEKKSLEIKKDVVLPKLQLDCLETIEKENSLSPINFKDRIQCLRTMLDALKCQKRLPVEHHDLLVQKYASCLVYLDKKLAFNKLDLYMDTGFWHMIDTRNEKTIFSPKKITTAPIPRALPEYHVQFDQKETTIIPGQKMATPGKTLVAPKKRLVEPKKTSEKKGSHMYEKNSKPINISHARNKSLLSPTSSIKIEKFNLQTTKAIKCIASFVCDLKKNVGNMLSQPDGTIIEKEVIQKITPRQSITLEFSELFDQKDYLSYKTEKTIKEEQAFEKEWNATAECIRKTYNWLNTHKELDVESVIYFSDKNNLRNFIDEIVDQNQSEVFKTFLFWINRIDSFNASAPLGVKEKFAEEVKNVKSIMKKFLTEALPYAYPDELECMYNIIIELENLLDDKTRIYFSELENVKAFSDKIVNQHRFYLFKRLSDLLLQERNGNLSEKDESHMDLTIERVLIYIQEVIQELKK